MNTTPWWKSKTIWFNVVTAVVAIVALPDFISILPVAALPYITLLNSLGNWILRVYFTSKPIT